MTNRCCERCFGRMGTLAGGGLYCRDKSCVCHSSLPEFMRTASKEEKERVFTEVAKQATEQQRSSLRDGTPLGWKLHHEKCPVWTCNPRKFHDDGVCNCECDCGVQQEINTLIQEAQEEMKQKCLAALPKEREQLDKDDPDNYEACFAVHGWNDALLKARAALEEIN